MMACASRRTSRSVSTFFFLGMRGIGERSRTVRPRRHRYRKVRNGKLLTHILRPLKNNEVGGIFHELSEPERGELCGAREAVRVDMNKPRKRASARQIIYLFKNECRTRHGILDPELFGECFRERRLPCPEFSRK